MINPVSTVKFCGNDPVSVQSLLQRDGRFSQKPSQKVAPSTEKHDRELSTTAKTLISLGVVLLATAAYLGYAVKNGRIEKVADPGNFKDKLKNVAFTVGEKVKNWTESFIGIFKTSEKVTTNAENNATTSATGTK